jgi:anti-anti-sigma regulatory factor
MGHSWCLSEEVHGDVVVVRLSGFVHNRDAPRDLHQRIVHIVAKGCRKVVIETSGLSYIGDVAASQLIAALCTMSDVGGELVISGTPKATAWFVDPGIFKVYRNQHDAIASFSDPEAEARRLQAKKQPDDSERKQNPLEGWIP